MDIKDLLDDIFPGNRLSVEDIIKNEAGSNTVDLEDSNDFARWSTHLDNYEDLEQDEEASQVSEDFNSIQYINNKFIVTLLGDLNNDIYSLIIREL